MIVKKQYNEEWSIVAHSSIVGLGIGVSMIGSNYSQSIGKAKQAMF